ncbi:hypothetical protein BJ138DRAFT_1084495 [Hygrophoropsis aurantiaca]|uniref:Uncharacterized protein n=1 Tax=Hygrophoropsis aurantiaca TaxID=72124 RepID=A0ACB8AGZ2_9AGAM|nr:hypothetical protein BJ138DRAFT_1084495 [Hygrophoropsis aurantiaca]
MAAVPTTSAIRIKTICILPSDPSLPALALRITSLVDSYMLWVGVTDQPAENIENAPPSGSLCKDWACAMPVAHNSSQVGPATSLFHSSSSDIAFSMAQRLARRFRKQIFLSIDIPTTFQTASQGSRLMLDAEKGIVDALKVEISA